MNKNSAITLFALIWMAILIGIARSDSGLEKMEYTLNLMKEGDEFIEVGYYNDIVMIMGNTGSGKSTLAQLIAGNNDNLVSKEVGDNTGEFIIEDLNDKISNNSTLVSKTIFPELVYDKITETPYYDCPGFSDTRNSSIDIASSYFIHKVLDHGKNVKIVFVVNYSSVKEGVDRMDFLILLRHIATLFKNIEKFGSGMSLVVTKIENNYIKKDDELVLVPDDKVVLNVANFLSNAKTSLLDMIQHETGQKKIVYENAIKLVDILVTQENGIYSKIGLFRRPDEPGPLSKIPMMQENKARLIKVIESTGYIGKNEQDFGYTISDESQSDITDLVEQISTKISGHTISIGDEIRKTFEIQETNFRDINILKSYFAQGNEGFIKMLKSLDNIRKPKELADAITQCLHEINVPHSEDHIINIVRYHNFLEFLQLVSPRDLILKPLEWTTSLGQISKYLDDSTNTYTFLVDTYVKLGDWSIQRDTSKFNVDNLRLLINQIEGRNELINGGTFEPFLQEIYYEEIKQGYTIRGYDAVRNAEFNSMKRTVVFEMLDLALIKKTTVNCINGNNLVAKGDYIKLSEVLQTQCPQTLQRLEITATYKIYIDTDFIYNAPNVHVVMVAPTWEIVDTRKIHLIGVHGEVHGAPKADNGAVPNYGGITGQPGGNGVNGAPGRRGLTGGSFLGIGATFLNGQNLEVASIGGTGSPGQHGGDGVNGENGKDVDWQYIRTEKHGNILNKKTKHYYKQEGGAGGAGGNGGLGGLGGLGGPPSIVQIYELEEPSKVIIQMVAGPEGAHGQGGGAGIGGTSGNQCTGNTEQRSNVGINGGKGWHNIECHKDKAPDGAPGAAAANGDGREGLAETTYIPDHVGIVNSFKRQVTENLISRIKSFYLKQFTNKLNEQPVIKNLYGAVGLSQELEFLESQFYRLNEEIDLVPLYQSILTRTLEYAQNLKENENTPPFRKVLSYVYSAVLSKLCSYKNDDDNSLIIDIKEHLEYAMGNIRRLQTTQNKVLIMEINASYKEKIDLKIDEGNALITNNIMPEFDKMNEEMNSKIDVLLDEIIALQNNAELNKQELIKKQREAVNAMDKALGINVLKGIGAVASMFGPYGAAVGVVINVATSVSKSLSMDTSSDTINKNIPEGVRNLLTTSSGLITKWKDEKMEVLKKQQEELGKENNPELEEVKNALNQVSADPNIKTGNEKALKGQGILSEKLNQLKSLGQDITENVKSAISVIEFVSHYSKIADVSMDIYRKYQQDKQKVGILGKEIAQMQQQIDSLRAYQQQVHDTLIPLIEKMTVDIQDVIARLGTTSQIGLDVTRWQVQSSIKDMKVKIKGFTSGFNAQDDLVAGMDKISEAMDALINVYDRIQVYNEQKTLADYISDIASAGSQSIIIEDATLNAAVTKLDLVIKSNIVLSSYRSAINGLKQYIFPFAEYYLGEFKLPTDIVVENSIDDLVQKSVNQIDSLRLKLIKSDASLDRKYDQFLHDGDFVINDNGDEPFYVWRSDEHFSSIYKLLSGEEIVIPADITKGSRKNSIKFNKINLQIKSDVPEIQQKIDEELKALDLNITHMGNSYYRCDSKFYVIPSESQSIRYSFAKNELGEPVRKNQVYTKLLERDYMLSPYAMWTISFRDPNRGGVAELPKYAEHIYLELSGHGQYISGGSNICNTVLEDYYRADKSLSVAIKHSA